MRKQSTYCQKSETQNIIERAISSLLSILRIYTSSEKKQHRQLQLIDRSRAIAADGLMALTLFLKWCMKALSYDTHVGLCMIQSLESLLQMIRYILHHESTRGCTSFIFACVTCTQIPLIAIFNIPFESFADLYGIVQLMILNVLQCRYINVDLLRVPDSRSVV